MEAVFISRIKRVGKEDTLREKIIRIPVLILLISANLILLFTYIYENVSALRVNAQQMEQVLDLYKEVNITFRQQPSGALKRFKALALEPADLDAMVQSFLDDADFDLTYIYGAKTQYNSGSMVLIADWEDHSIAYRNTAIGSKEQEEPWRQVVLSDEQRLMLETVARKFAQRWLGNDVIATGWVRSAETLTVTFAQVASGVIYYFNAISVTVVQEGVQSAEIQYWSVQGDGDEVDTMPIDEMLYLQLKTIRQQTMNVLGGMGEKQGDTVLSIMNGYSIEVMDGDTATALPTMTMLMESGKQWRRSYCHE